MGIAGNLAKLLPEPLVWPLRRRRAAGRRNISQIGQDFWVAGEVFNGKRGGYFVDIGAADGYDISNTLLLETRYGWSGMCVEANPAAFNTLRAIRRAVCVNACVDGEAGVVQFRKDGLFGGIVDTNRETATEASEVVTMPTVTLVELLERHGAPKAIDYLSVDVEGAEERMLSGFDYRRYCFRCMTIERPGAALREVLARNGYRLVKELPGLDAFFVHNDFLADYAENAVNFWSRA